MTDHPNAGKSRSRRVVSVTTRSQQLIADARRLVPVAATSGDPRVQITTLATAVLQEMVQSSEAVDATRVETLSTIALRAIDLEADIRAQSVRAQADALVAVSDPLHQLRYIDSLDQFVRNLCRVLVSSTPFSRALLSRVDRDDTWIPWAAHADDDDHRCIPQAWLASERAPLSALPVEQEVVRSCRAILVEDLVCDDAPYAVATQMRSFVVAPIAPRGEVVGLLYADYYPSDRRADEFDRQFLALLAADSSTVYEQAILHDRIRARRVRLRDGLATIEASMAAIARRTDPELGHSDDAKASDAAVGALQKELTFREREIFALIMRGDGNRAIGATLFIAEGTVKSHVKHILRKLGVMNRSELIARYTHTFTGPGQGSDGDSSS